jgi:hypothetical protein
MGGKGYRDMIKEIAKIEKNAQEEIIVQLIEFKGYYLVDLRVWAKSVMGQTGKPTKKGITVKPGLLPELIEAIQEAERTYQEAQEKGARV